MATVDGLVSQHGIVRHLNAGDEMKETLVGDFGLGSFGCNDCQFLAIFSELVSVDDEEFDPSKLTLLKKKMQQKQNNSVNQKLNSNTKKKRSRRRRKKNKNLDSQMNNTIVVNHYDPVLVMDFMDSLYIPSSVSSGIESINDTSSDDTLSVSGSFIPQQQQLIPKDPCTISGSRPSVCNLSINSNSSITDISYSSNSTDNYQGVSLCDSSLLADCAKELQVNCIPPVISINSASCSSVIDESDERASILHQLSDESVTCGSDSNGELNGICSELITKIQNHNGAIINNDESNFVDLILIISDMHSYSNKFGDTIGVDTASLQDLQLLIMDDFNEFSISTFNIDYKLNENSTFCSLRHLEDVLFKQWFQYQHRLGCDKQSLHKLKFLLFDQISSSMNSSNSIGNNGQAKDCGRSIYCNRRGRKKRRYKMVHKNRLQNATFKHFGGK